MRNLLRTVLAVTGAAACLFVVVGIVVACALFGDKFGVKHVSAVSRPVFYTKNVVIDDPTVNNHERLGAKKITFQGRSEDYRLGMLLAVFDGFEALGNLPGWENSPCLNYIVGMTGAISEIEVLALLENAYDDIAMHILCWRFTNIHELRRNQKGFAEGERDTTFHELESHPSPFILSEIDIGVGDALLGSPRGSIVRPPDFDSEYCIDDKDTEAECLQHESGVVYPVSLCVAGHLAMLFGWFRLRLCRCRGDLGAGFAGLFLGFPVSAWFGMIVVDRIF
jgi:hypothetical protein